jgi:hypothetical protein
VGTTLGFDPKLMRGIQDFVLDHLLPDTCSVYPQISTPVEDNGNGNGNGNGLNDGGLTNEGGLYHLRDGDAMTYNGNTSIPCRLDSSRYYRDAQLFGQEMTINDHSIHLPYDFDIPPDVNIIVNSRRYEVRKMVDNTSWQPTRELLVTEVTVGGR